MGRLTKLKEQGVWQKEEIKEEPKKKGFFSKTWDFIRGTFDNDYAVKIAKEKSDLRREEKEIESSLKESKKPIGRLARKKLGLEEKRDTPFLTARLGIPTPTLAGTTPIMIERGVISPSQQLNRETLKHLTLNDFKEGAKTVFSKAPEIPEMFIPAITEFSKTTMGILGEGLAYAIDKNVREQYERGNMDILPLISKKTTTDIAKLTIAAGIETSVYKLIPNYAKTKLSIGTRAGIGALQGLGFGIAEGIAKDYTTEEIMDNLPYYMVSGGVLEAVAPYIQSMLSTQIKNLTPEAKASFKSIWNEVRGKGMPDLSRPLRDQLLPRKIVAEQGEEIIGEIPVKVKTKPKVEPIESIEIDPLIQEAKNYKSADEFVKAQGALDQIKTKSQLTDIWNKAQEKPIIKPKTEPIIEPTKQTEQAFSKHYERIKNQLGETEGIIFDRINIKEEARKAFDYVSNPLPNVKQKALRVAYGLEPAPQGLNAQAIRISMIESLKEAGKLQQARALAKETSLQFTRAAQDLNIAKLDIGSAGARKIESVLMADQLERVGKRLPDVIEGGIKLAPKEKALRAISKGAKEATDEIFKTAKIKSADDLLKAITC